MKLNQWKSQAKLRLNWKKALLLKRACNRWLQLWSREKISEEVCKLHIVIKKGYTRVQEKVDDICQDFTTAVTTDKEDGNEKIVAGFY